MCYRLPLGVPGRGPQGACGTRRVAPPSRQRYDGRLHSQRRGGGGLHRRTDLTDRQKRQYAVGVGVAIGSGVGLALVVALGVGVALDNIELGAKIGLAVGMSLGAALCAALK